MKNVQVETSISTFMHYSCLKQV